MLQVDKDLETAFLEKIKGLLVDGKSRQVTKKKKVRKYVYAATEDDNFLLTGKEVTVSEETVDYFDGIPSTVLEMLFNSLSVNNAIKLLELQGYQVIDPSQTAVEEKKGLSEKTLDTIKLKILGIESE